MFNKIVFLSLIILLLAVNAQARLVVYYPLNGDAKDMSGASPAANGTLVGNPTFEVGKFGQAIKLVNSSTQYVNCGQPDKIQITAKITMMAWIKVNSWAGGTWAFMLGRGDDSWRLGRATNANGAQAAVNSAAGTTAAAANGTTNINDAQWHHVAGVFDGTKVILYIDGKQDATASYTGPISASTQPFCIGANTTYPTALRCWDGWIDEVMIFDEALPPEKITELMNGGPSLSQGTASSPIPEDEDTDVYRKIFLSWKPGTYADTHNVFFGTDFNDVNDATIASHAGVTLTEGLDVNNLDTGTLDFGKTYYWRVDEVNAPSKPATYKGTTWSFTVEAYAYKLPKEFITVSVRNSAAKNDPNNTINEVGLDPNHMDQHSNSSGMWLSGTVSAADPAWIRYDFDKLYKIHEMLVWNYNSKLLLNSGFRQVLVEYSADGVSWTPITSVTEFAKGSGNMGYVYNTVVPFNDVAIKSVRITALSNWGTTYKNGGLSEIRFTYIPTRARIPSPEMDEANVAIDSALSWRPGREAVTHDVYISTDKQVIINGTAPAHTVSVNTYSPLLDFGRAYYWSVTEVNNAATPKRWESDIWSFSTIEYASIDDFEDYNGTDGYYIWQTWDDGASNPSNGGSQIGYINNPFIESVIAQHGKQSAPVYYDNSTSSNVSEVSRTFATALNWQVNGADTLKLYYKGNAITFAEPSPGVIAMSAEGTDIYGNSDQFRFAYKTLTGNGSITARVDSIQNTNAWAKAGIMIRGTLDPNSMHVATVLGANGTAELESRATKGGTTTSTDVTGQGFPCWVRISRTGNTFTAQRSKDGVNWYSFGTDPNTPSTVTIAMSNQVYIGIAVTSHAADVLAAATLSNVSTTGTVSAGAWTVAAIGDTDMANGTNTIDALYVGIEDSTGKSAKVYAPANAVGSGSWIGWIIPYSQFTGVNMTKVKKLSIGIGNSAAPAKGKGMIFIDNISYGHTFVK